MFGGKKMFGFGVLCTAVLTLITPLAARYNLGTFIAVRVIEGIGEVCVSILHHVCTDHNNQGVLTNPWKSRNFTVISKQHKLNTEFIYDLIIKLILYFVGRDISSYACYLGKLGPTLGEK